MKGSLKAWEAAHPVTHGAGPATDHLMTKSGCFDNASTISACETLLAQVPVLEGWIDTAAEGPTPFIVLGDFNRQFNQPNDRIWANLDDGEPANADLSTLIQG
jgi:hypothetical protein